MALNPLSRLRNILGRHGKPHPKRSTKGRRAIGSSADPSRPVEPSQSLQVPTTQAELVLPGPTASPTLEPTTPALQPASLILHPAAMPIKEPEPVAARSLWDRAYDSLRAKDQQLVDKYEKLLSRELPPSPLSLQGAQCEHTNNTGESLEKTKNQIDNTNLRNRQDQLKTIIGTGLRRMEEKKTKYIIFGHEFVLRDQITQVARFVQDMRTLVDQAVKVSPEASLAWAGVCTILPILTNTVAAGEANRGGFAYVTSRMRFYVELEHLLWPSGLKHAAGLKKEFEDQLAILYQNILEFQIRTVLRFYQTRLARLGDDGVNHDVWQGMLSKIQELEMTFDRDWKKINDSASRMELEALSRNADKFLTDMNSILSVLVETRGKSASSSFNNWSSGHQFNASGGVQNNNTGLGKQFNGATFDGPVVLY